MRNERYAPSYGAVSWQSGMSQRVFDTRVLPLFGFGLIFTALVAFISRDLPNIFAIGAGLIAVVMSFTSGAWLRSERNGLNTGLFALFTALCGVMLVPLLRWAAVIGGGALIVQAFAVTGITFGSLMAIGMVSNRDFTTWGRFLMMGFIGLILASVVNIFTGGSAMALAISCFGVLLFSAYVLYSMSMIKNHLTDADYVTAALMLYINFINLFQQILHIFGIMGSDD
ncbi:MAG: Bax inhibitor-1/YccA family protein [Candidatus Sericytochromatia bacterium]